MILRTLEHVPFEGPAAIATWAKKRGIKVERTALYAGESAPDPDNFDILCVMGGPMNIYEEGKYPWLSEEKRLIKSAINAGKKVVGVCLGAQLIACCLGAEIVPNKYKEIGWLPIMFAEEAKKRFGISDAELLAFHWHGDTFALPADAERFATSEACANQGFTFGENVLALQFHIEYSPESIKAMIEHCPEDFAAGGRFVQSAEQMLNGAAQRTVACNAFLERLLNSLMR